MKNLEKKKFYPTVCRVLGPIYKVLQKMVPWHIFRKEDKFVSFHQSFFSYEEEKIVTIKIRTFFFQTKY